MVTKKDFEKWMGDNGFHWKKLIITGVDNMSVLAANNPAMAAEEICLFCRRRQDGDDYLNMLNVRIAEAVAKRQALPVVRFADGEYAFYQESLKCNGLYEQAESVRHIRQALPLHVEALRKLARLGIIAPLIFPGNISAQENVFFAFLKKWKKEPSASAFISFLERRAIRLTGENYLPFYVVYAYLTSSLFALSAHRKKVCVLNSDSNKQMVKAWFDSFSSRPELVFVDMPAAYVATRWPLQRDEVLSKIPDDISLCIIGAGIGALLVCVDVAEKFSVPAIDAGHVLNMMNGRVDKSNGARLYTLRINS